MRVDTKRLDDIMNLVGELVLARNRLTSLRASFEDEKVAQAVAALDLVTRGAEARLPEQLVSEYSPGSSVYSKVWDNITRTADRFNEPGRFTTLIGYEWTSMPQGNNMHRNVVLRDGGEVCVRTRSG